MHNATSIENLPIKVAHEVVKHSNPRYMEILSIYKLVKHLKQKNNEMLDSGCNQRW
jgi:hypothetical protein